LAELPGGVAADFCSTFLHLSGSTFQGPRAGGRDEERCAAGRCWARISRRPWPHRWGNERPESDLLAISWPHHALSRGRTLINSDQSANPSCCILITSPIKLDPATDRLLLGVVDRISIF